MEVTQRKKKTWKNIIATKKQIMPSVWVNALNIYSLTQRIGLWMDDYKWQGKPLFIIELTQNQRYRLSYHNGRDQSLFTIKGFK